MAKKKRVDVILPSDKPRTSSAKKLDGVNKKPAENAKKITISVKEDDAEVVKKEAEKKAK